MSELRSFTPREIVSELDRYIVGQHKAKRAVAIALRHRWRRQQVADDLRDEIAPKNIIMIGPTGVGKTEIARRLAKLARAPFLKVEASKFTEVGYVGRDVESIVRDLVESAIKMVREEERERVQVRAQELAEERLLQLLAQARSATEPSPAPQVPQAPANLGPFVFNFGAPPQPSTPQPSAQLLQELRAQLRSGELDEVEVEVDVMDQSNPLMTIFGANGQEELELNFREVLGQLPGFRGRTKRRSLKVPEARRVLEEVEVQKLLDMDRIQREAVERTEQLGIVFIDEIDKVAGRPAAAGADVSREGVQRDLLPIVEGSTVTTKYGPVRSDHVLFIAAGAFHVSKVSDLIPELQGRFPIRVELESLGLEDFIRVLTEPRNALTRQYTALLATEGIELRFTQDAIEAIASYASEANKRAENIGARRLHTVLEALLEEISFTAPERQDREIVLDAAYVKKVLAPILGDEDLARFML